MYSNNTASNNGLCPFCGGHHNVLVFSSEDGSHIVTRPFSKKKATKTKVINEKRREITLDFIASLWPKEMHTS
jgi:hypothetical protein